jgi:hypothetical protein
MAREAHDHSVNLDEADRHLRRRHVPTAAAIVVAAAVVALLAYLRSRGVTW